MANPLTAKNLEPEKVNVEQLVTDICKNPEMCEISLLAKGTYGFIFSIGIPAAVSEKFKYYPFKTFTIDPENGSMIYTSRVSSRVSSQYFNRFCCKLVPIMDESPQKIMFTKEGTSSKNVAAGYTDDDDDTPMSQDTSTSLSFNNECHKQRHIYALTNYDLNSICLPLFYFDIVHFLSSSIWKKFIECIFVQTRISIKSPPQGLQYGISFMPFSPNTYSTSPIRKNLTILDIFSTPPRIEILREIISNLPSVDGIPTLLTPPIVDTLFKISEIYTFISVISLIIRLYCVGYCHGDLHFGNIVVYPEFPSSMRLHPKSYFTPTFSLIDTGFAYQHGQEVPPDILKNYESFKNVIRKIITNRTLKSGLNMREFPYHNWISIIFEDNIEYSKTTINHTISRAIFRLFQFYERYRRNFELHQAKKLILFDPTVIDNLRAQNHRISASVNEYIASIPETTTEAKFIAFNSHGGHRRNYSVSNRKQTKINKKHTTRSVRRRKSQKRRRRQRSKSKRY